VFSVHLVYLGLAVALPGKNSLASVWFAYICNYDLVSLYSHPLVSLLHVYTSVTSGTYFTYIS
jgi:hypothetical protein